MMQVMTVFEETIHVGFLQAQHVLFLQILKVMNSLPYLPMAMWSDVSVMLVYVQASATGIKQGFKVNLLITNCA